jgi:hypothetical protein
MMSAKYTVRMSELSIDQLDKAARLIAERKAGHVSAMLYVGLHAEHPSMTLDHIKSLPASEFSLIQDTATDEDDDEDLPTNAP